jgi:hypothetical protein
MSKEVEKIVDEKFDGIMLEGKEIPPEFTRFYVGNGVIDSYQLKRLLDSGMPHDLLRWQLKIDGAGIGEPDLFFLFAGVFNPPAGGPRPDAQAPFSFTPHVYTIFNGEVFRFDMLAFVWEIMVNVKDTKAVIRQTYDPQRKSEPSTTDGYALLMQNLASNTLVSKERAKLIHRLERGYGIIGSLWEGISKREYVTRVDDIPPDAFRESLFAWAKRLGERGGKPKKNRFAKEMDISARTFSKYLDREPGLWETAISVFEASRLEAKTGKIRKD